MFCLPNFFRILLLALVSILPQLVQGVDNKTTNQNDETIAKVNTVVIEILNMQKVLDKIKQEVSGETNDSKLNTLNDMAIELSGDTNTLMSQLIQQRAQLQTQLAVLGPVPTADNVVKETAEVTHNRSRIENQKVKIDDQIKQIEAIKSGSINLSIQIVNLRRGALKTQLALNAGSIFGPHFWFPLFTTHSSDNAKISNFINHLLSAAKLSWQPSCRLGTCFWVLFAVLIAIFGRRYLEEFLTWVGIHHLPEGRLRRSFLAAATVITTLLSVVIVFICLNQAFTRNGNVVNDVRTFADKLVDLSIFCGLIAGLGRALLSTHRPSWRLANISHEVALALKPYPLLTAVLVFIFQTIEIFNSSATTSVSTTIFANGITALLIGATALSIRMRTNHVHRRIIQECHQPMIKSTMIGLIQISLTLVGVAIMIALTIGYITLARFLSYELIWVGIVLGLFYIFSQLIVDSFESLFSIHNIYGKRIQTSFNIDERHLGQLAVLLGALGKTVMVIAAAMALMNDSFGSSTPIELVQKAIEFWGGKGLYSLNIIPTHMINALIFLIIGIWVLRSIKHWLEKDLLPITTMDQGMQISLITLFSNIGYVLVILMTLSIMGLQWNKLAWIVSALSVGIGFGLQEIVKNFISGLILLTERPVKVGDLVSISGIEGDIRRINVRATEIQLGDKSTVIVPNSQLISQTVRNATMGNARGVATITLTFPLNINPQQVRQLLLDVYNESDCILAHPEPLVSFKDLTNTSIILSVTGNVSSPRLVSQAKSDLLFDILTRLRKECVILSIPQTMIIERTRRKGL